jgi:hypothetical protein
VLLCLASIAPVVFTLIISQLISCISALCGLDFPNCNVAGDVIVGADGISGYISLLASLYGGGEVVKCVVSNDWDLLWSEKLV